MAFSKTQPLLPPFPHSDVGLPRAAVVGVLGGGQLGRMLAQAAVRMGVRVKVLDPTPSAPAAAAADHVLGSFTDPAAVAAFASSGVDILTVEIEHVDASALEASAAAAGVDAEPTPATLSIIQDKCAQKRHFEAAGVPVPAFGAIPDAGAAAAFGDKHGFPFMLKARFGAYDGRGNAVVASPSAIAAAAASLGGYGAGDRLYAEAWAPFDKELAVMVARARDGTVQPFPVVETIHRDSVCWVTEAPADVPQTVSDAATRVALTAVASLDGAGVFGVELFASTDGTVLLNEVAPRPHNSGHYTIEGCATSQYEQHLRAVMGWPLGDASLKVGSALMLNILGTADGDAGIVAAHETMAAAYGVPGASVHWYGKDGVSAGRKVGHVTIVGASRDQARARLAAVDPAAAAALAKGWGGGGGVAAAAARAADTSSSSSPLVSIIMGSDSDLPTMAAAADALATFGIPCEVTIVSAHRTPDRMVAFARSAASRGVRAIIAGAGGAAHLPGMVAALTPLPVVGVPVVPAGAGLGGVDALLSIAQMPRGVPVATVGVGGAANAGLLAARILGSADPGLQARIAAWQGEQRDAVLEKAARLEEGGWQRYLGK